MKIHADHSEQPGEVRIELIPLIDVIFCILTFFILAAVTLTRQSAINVDLPSATTGTTQMREMLLVSVDPVGQTYIEQQPVSRNQLYQALQDYIQASPNGVIVLYASRLSSYNDVVEVLDLLRSVGGSRVALATLPDSVNNDTANPDSPLPELGAPVTPLDPFGLPGSSGLDNPGTDPNLFPGLDPLPLNPNQPEIPPSAPTQP